MTDAKHAPGYVPNQRYTQEDWDEVCGSPELTAEDFARARPIAEVMPEFAAALERRHVLRASLTEMLDSPHIDRDVVEAYQATGPGWQVRMNEILRKALRL